MYTELLRTYSEYGNAEIVRYLLDQGADVAYCFPRTPHPLCEAARHGHEAIVDMLLDAGADPNLVSAWGKHDMTKYGFTTPLAAAASGGSLAIVRKLLARGARQKADEPRLALWKALRLEHTAMAELLLSSHPPIDTLAKLMMRKKLSEARLESMLELAPDVPLGWGPTADHVGEMDWGRYFPHLKTEAEKIDMLHSLLEEPGVLKDSQSVLLLPPFVSVPYSPEFIRNT